MNTTNEPAGIDLDKLPRYSVGVDRCTMDRDDYEGEWLKRSDVQTALARRAPAPVEAADEVTRLDILGLIRAQCHRCYASAIDREEIDTKYMAEIDEALKKYALAQQSPAPVVAHDAPEAPVVVADEPLCPACQGSGEGMMTVGAGPDAYEVPCNCPYCGGSGGLLDAYNGLVALLAAEREKYIQACGKLFHASLAAPASAQPDRGAAHAQQEAVPAEVTKSQERDYNWLLGLAKSKGYHTVYGALYAAPTAVPYLGILPSHSEREAANAGKLPPLPKCKMLVGHHLDSLHVLYSTDQVREIQHEAYDAGRKVGEVRDWQPMTTAPKDGTMVCLLVNFSDNATEDTNEPCVTIGANCFDHDGVDEWKFAGWNWQQDCFTEGVGAPVHWMPMLGQSPATVEDKTIAAGQEAANAKDAARVTYTCKGKGGAYSLIGVAYGAGTSRDTTVNLYREVGTGVMYFRTPADFHDRMERINAAMAAVGAAGQEGGDK